MSSSSAIVSRDEEYSAFVARRWTRLVGAATLMGCDLHEAEDLVQAAMLKCYVSWSKVRKADDQDAYVYRILVNTFRSARRRRSSSEQPHGFAAGGLVHIGRLRRRRHGLQRWNVHCQL